MEDRQASVTIDDFENLVDQAVDHNGGASAFIDDYFCWRSYPTVEENIKKIQEEGIPRVEQWAQRTGASFAAEKTELIHLTRRKTVHGKGQIVINGQVIKPADTVKLLGVIFDKEMRWKEHVQKAVKRATKVNIALSGLRHLRPEQMRQLYQACVTPIIDYASTVWQNPLRDKIHLRFLETVQRTALIRILSAVRTVSTAALEVESHILPTHLRLKQRGQIVSARLRTLPDDHPIHERDHPIVKIAIEPDREKAQANAWVQQSSTSITVFSDASGKGNQLGAAAVALDHNQQITGSRQISIGSMEYWSVYAAKLMAIYYAIGLVFQLAQKKHATTTATQDPATILSDSMSALQVIANSWNKSGQRIIQAIHQSAAELKARGIPLRLQWVPGYCGDPGNETADRLAKEAVGAEKKHPFQHLLSREKAFIRNKIKNEWEQEWKTS
ncbi:hypothetical protein CAN33_0054905 [Aspergillus niger]|uniref:RNase H type-1 domain-containing protein n=1 Tax=Aspergillus niger TaxID=5061 RepID=A0A505INS2_ASPNG|nr:hypothetical protein CAN33_0054905 [Aspergillus niger]